MAEAGVLTLVATPIGNLGDLAPRVVAALRDADVIAAEDTRRTRKLLAHMEIPARGRLIAVHEHNEARMAPQLVDRVRKGRRVVYVTDAGMPGISDPGERLVQACVEAGLPVEVVPGPSAALAALVVSGLPTERFAFEGFLPRKTKDRRGRIEALAHERRTTVIFESPHRVTDTLRDLTAAVGPERRVAVARELTKAHEEVWRGTLAEAPKANAVREARGEYVIVLGPAAEAELPSSEEVAEALEAAFDEGASLRDAAADVAAALGVPKRGVYDLALELKRRDPGGA